METEVTNQPETEGFTQPATEEFTQAKLLDHSNPFAKRKLTVSGYYVFIACTYIVGCKTKDGQSGRRERMERTHCCRAG